MSEQRIVRTVANVEEIAALKATIANLESRLASRSTMTFKVSEKGALSVYGLQRLPVTLYASQWERLMAKRDDVLAFVKAHADTLARKD